MGRFVKTLAVIAGVMVIGTAASAQNSVRVDDGLRLPVPPELREAWQQVQENTEWSTEAGRQISGSFEGFQCRRIEVLPATTNPEQPVRVRITWFEGGECRQITRNLDDISEERRRRLSQLFGEPLRNITSRRAMLTVLAEFDGEISRSEREEREREERSRNERTSFGQNEDGSEPRTADEESERPGNDPRERERDAEVRVPFRSLSESSRSLLRPFAEIARQSFQRRLSMAECSPSEEEEEEETEEDPQEEEEPEEEEEGREVRRFGFTVIKFVAAAGSLSFEEESRREVCVAAPNARAAIRKVRERFQDRIDDADEERVRYRIDPNPRACSERRREDDENDEREGEEELEPVPDPLDTDSDDIEAAIPLFELD